MQEGDLSAYGTGVAGMANIDQAMSGQAAAPTPRELAQQQGVKVTAADQAAGLGGSTMHTVSSLPTGVSLGEVLPVTHPKAVEAAQSAQQQQPPVSKPAQSTEPQASPRKQVTTPRESSVTPQQSSATPTPRQSSKELVTGEIDMYKTQIFMCHIFVLKNSYSWKMFTLTDNTYTYLVWY